MRKIFLTLIYSLSLTSIFAQDSSNQVWRVWYMTAKDGKAKQLENIFSYFLRFIEDPWGHIGPSR